jgi:hypothetical protein
MASQGVAVRLWLLGRLPFSLCNEYIIISQFKLTYTLLKNKNEA